MANNMPKTPAPRSADLLSLPRAAGRAIVERAAIVVCPVLQRRNFVRFCTERGLGVNEERLRRFEELGLFRPLFRVRTPTAHTAPFFVPVRKGNNWFRLGWAWDATRSRPNHPIPPLHDEQSEAYYSIFQLDALAIAINQMTLTVQLESLVGSKLSEAHWILRGRRWTKHANMFGRLDNQFRSTIALLCQFISNAYFPLTQTDGRIIRQGVPSYSDPWLQVHLPDTEWRDLRVAWNPKTAEVLFDLTPSRLRHAYGVLAGAQADIDPLEKWHDLVQFIALDQREKLKGDALRAETLRAGALMLRLLHKDLYGEDLPLPNETRGTAFTHFPEVEIRKDVRRHLEFVANRFGVNPQPKLCLFVEGRTEAVAVQEIFEKHFGVHPGRLAIEIIDIQGVNTATGGKDDRFRAILRLIDYLHHHQTLTFLILDNEGYAKRLKASAQKAKSIHHQKRHVTRHEYIKVWRVSFEFDNFTDTELAKALTELTRGAHRFRPSHVAACRSSPNPGSMLSNLYEQGAARGLDKIALTRLLLASLWSASGKKQLAVARKPIFKVLSRVYRLAALNPFPVRQEYWERNQVSKYLGKKRS
jgi:hypothetical protein